MNVELRETECGLSTHQGCHQGHEVCNSVTKHVSTYIQKMIGGLGKVRIHYVESGAPKENKVLSWIHSI